MGLSLPLNWDLHHCFSWLSGFQACTTMTLLPFMGIQLEEDRWWESSVSIIMGVNHLFYGHTLWILFFWRTLSNTLFSKGRFSKIFDKLIILIFNYTCLHVLQKHFCTYNLIFSFFLSFVRKWESLDMLDRYYHLRFKHNDSRWRNIRWLSKDFAVSQHQEIE